MGPSMKRFAPLALFVAGLTILCFLMPYFNAALPRGVRVTRSQGLAIADAAARQIGIPVDRSWSNIIWTESAILDKELQNDADRRRRAFDDPVIGPRLGAYHIRYFRRGTDKQYAYGYTVVSGTNGEVIGNRLQFTPEERGASPSEAELRPKADAFVRSRSFAGAPSPKFEQARPVIQRNRTDWTFRYRVTSNFQTGNVVPYLYVYFNGHRFAGWDLSEEYADGHPFRENNGGEVVVTFLRFFFIFGTLLTLLVIFLKKYHAGEVGIRSGSFLFAVTFAIAIAYVLSFAASASRGTGFGSIDAQQTMFAMIGFILLFYYLPLSVLVFFGWSVGESYARERWGDRLASFDAILKRDAFNATVGRSVLRGVLVAPAVAAAALLPALIPLLTKSAHATMGIGGECVLFLGGPLTAFLTSAVEASMYPVVILFILAWTSRRRALAIGVVASIVFGSIVSTLGEVPIAPTSIRMMSGFGGMAALVAIFLAYDLLATVVAQFTATLLFTLGPLITISRGDLHQQTLITLLTPMLVAGAFGIAALMTRREVVYAYEDLAPHVKRIVERERVKAEIDAANRIHICRSHVGRRRRRCR